MIKYMKTIRNMQKKHFMDIILFHPITIYTICKNLSLFFFEEHVILFMEFNSAKTIRKSPDVRVFCMYV